jgi:hypothetical protein
MKLAILDEGEFPKHIKLFSGCNVSDDIIFIFESSMVQEITEGWESVGQDPIF